MKVLCERAALLEGIQTVQKAVSPRSTLQILGNVLLETRPGGRLGMMAYDLEIGIETTVPAEIERAGSLTVPARVLGEVVSILPEAQVCLQVDERNVTEVRCQRSKYNLHGLPAEEFPRLPQLEDGVEVKVAGSVLSRMVRETRFASSSDDPRKVLTGVLTVLNGSEVQLVATDGYRLAWSRGSIAEEVDERVDVIVPARAYGEVARLIGTSDDPVYITATDNQVRFAIGDACVQSRLIDGQYPNWERVIPSTHDKEIVASVEELKAAVRRVSVVAREDGHKIIVDCSEDGLTLTAKSQIVGQAQEELGARCEGGPITIGFNSRYLLQLLEVLESEEVCIELREPENPGVYRPLGRDNYICLLMPMGVAQG